MVFTHKTQNMEKGEHEASASVRATFTIILLPKNNNNNMGVNKNCV